MIYELKKASDLEKEEKSLARLDHMLSLKKLYQTSD